MSTPPTETPLIAFDIDRWDNEAFKSLPEWIQERIKKITVQGIGSSLACEYLHTRLDEVHNALCVVLVLMADQAPYRWRPAGIRYGHGQSGLPLSWSEPSGAGGQL